jgi:hypothetical protein
MDQLPARNTQNKWLLIAVHLGSLLPLALFG